MKDELLILLSYVSVSLTGKAGDLIKKISMKKIVAAEETGQFLVALFGLYQLHIPIHIGWWILLFFSPDAGALGYLINRKVGAIGYNLLHHKLIAIVLIGFGFLSHQTILMAIGLLIYAHSSFDRVVGYGLKYLDNPNRTHLGFIGKEKFRNQE